jgi:hypothetical protein
VSARSASRRIQGCVSEAQIVLLLFSFPQKCSWAQEPCKECADKLSLRVANLSEVLREFCCRCGQGRRKFGTGKYLKVAVKSVRRILL